MGPATGTKGKGGARTAPLAVLVLLMVLGVASPALAAPGDRDTSFGEDGIVTGGDNFAQIAVQPDGKILTAGSYDDGLVLTRHDRDGSPDPSFGANGRTTTNLLQRPQVNALALQPDGKIVVAGQKGWDYALNDNCEPSCFLLARYNADGSPDTSFGGDGIVATKVGSWYDTAHALAFQPDGKIVAAGTAIGNEGSVEDDQYDFALARYDADGSLDTTFGGDGKLTTPMSSFASGVQALSVRSGGKIAAVGYGGGLAVAHYNPDGSLDATFSDDGRLVTRANLYEETDGTGNGGLAGLESYSFQPDGKIVVGGMVFGEDVYGNGYNYDFGLARYNADGSPDTTFDGDGKLSTELGSPEDGVRALALQPDGRMVAAGWSLDEACSCNSKLAMVRYKANGALDTAFGGDGKAFGKIQFNRGFALQSDGGVLASGAIDGAGGERLSAMARHYGGDDTTPPGPVTGFGAETQNRDVSLSWTNPTDSDFGATRILRSASGYAAEPEQAAGQTKVYEGPAASFTESDLADGDYYYTAFARDKNGNWSPAAKAAIDSMPPQTEWYAAPMPVDTLPVEFYFRSSEPRSTFQCKVDDAAFSACTSPKEYTDLTDGPHTFYVRAKDAAGNLDPTPASFDWTVDTRKPVTTIDSGPSGTISSGSASFTFSADEPVASDPGYVCSLDGGGHQLCESPMTYEGLGNGQHTFEVFADDRAGNRGLVATRTWTVGPESTSKNLVPDETLTSDAEGDGATASDPVETAITSPVGGATSVTETVAVTQTEPGNYSFLGQQANITTPPSTADNPLRFEFRLDSSLIPAGETESTVQVFRNGVRVPDCADGASTVAEPDPCVLGRQLVDGDVRFTVLTSAASRWNFGVFDDAPKVVAVAPTHLARNASAKANVTATFSETMAANTINATSFVLVKRGTKTAIPAKVSYAATAKKATLNPKRDLKPGATYVATVRRGATDATGNALAEDKTWTFTVKKR